MLARGLSGGRRRGAKLVLGESRCFSTDIEAVFVPWPLPPLAQESRPGFSLFLALQAAPTKEVAAHVVLDRAGPRHLAALQLAEGAAALGWICDAWPGLAEKALEYAPGLEPEGWEDLSAEELARRADARAARDRSIEVPELLGALGIVRMPASRLRHGLSRIAWRMPAALAQRLERMGGRFGVEIDVFGHSDTDEGDRAPSQGLSSTGDPPWQPRMREGLPYPEWDLTTSSYREDHVTVIERRPEGGYEAPGTPRDDLEAWFSAPLERRWRGRLTEGPDIDIDGTVDALLERVAGEGAADRVYRDRLRTERDLACALLIDLSGSLAHGRLLEHEVELADALVDAMARSGELHAVFGFSTRGRHEVYVDVLQDFADEGCRPSGALLRPGGHTRIGAAIRHVTVRVADEPAARHALIVLSDAVPFDDGYEGAYADADLVKAVEEAEERDVAVAFLSVGAASSGREWMVEELGERLHRIDGQADLAPALAEAHAVLAS